MKTDVGEYIVGAYLKLELSCDVVDYNVRSPGGKLQGLGELDVVGYNFRDSRVYLCEVTTHILGLGIGNSDATVKKIREKHARQKEYARQRLTNFQVSYQFWSPCVSKGLSKKLSEINELDDPDRLDLVINGRYRDCIEQLRKRARKEKHDAVNPFFRMLQIMESMKGN